MKIPTGGREKKQIDISNALNKNYDTAKKRKEITIPTIIAVPITEMKGIETGTRYSLPSR